MIKTRSEQFKNLLEILIIALLVIIAFFWTTKSYAFTAAQQLINDSTETNNNSYVVQTLGNNFNNTIVTSVTVNMGVSSATSSAGINIDDCGTSPCIPANTLGYPTYFSGYNCTITTTMNNCTFNFPTSTILTTGHYWAIRTSKNTGGNTLTGGTTNDNAYPAGTCYSFYSGTWQNNCQTIKDLYFIIVGSTQTTSTVTSLIYPTDGMNTRDFTYWKIQASGNFSQIGVRYKLASSTNYQFVNIISPQSTIDNQILSILKNVSLTPTNSASSSFRTWNAQLYSIDSNGNETDQTPITFNVGNYYADQTSSIAASVGIAPNLNDYNNASTSIEGCQVDTFFSIPYIRNLGQCLINVAALGGNYLFTPPANFTQYLTDSADNFKNIFPFSIAFPLASSTQNSINAGYGAEKTFVLPLLISSTSVTFFDSSTVNTVMGSNNKTTYFSVAGSIMYAITGYKIIMAIF